MDDYPVSACGQVCYDLKPGKDDPPRPPPSVTILDNLADPPEHSAAEELVYAIVAQHITDQEFLDWSQETETVMKPDNIAPFGAVGASAAKAVQTVV
jgi:hypothetical protein